MKYYYCPKCTVRFDHNRQQCPNCGNYSINCEEVEETKGPDFNFDYIKELCPNDDIFRKALTGYFSGFVPSVILNLSESMVGQSFDVRVHSFTCDNVYRVSGEFDEGGKLSSCSCSCDDFSYRHHYCKHIIATLMKIYKEDCEEKYGRVELLEKKSEIKEKHTVIETPTSLTLIQNLKRIKTKYIILVHFITIIQKLFLVVQAHLKL